MRCDNRVENKGGAAIPNGKKIEQKINKYFTHHQNGGKICPRPTPAANITAEVKQRR